MRNEMSRHLFRYTLFVLIFCLWCCNVGFSAIVHQTFSGTVLSASPGNALGLTSGDTVTGITHYDRSLLTGIGVEFIYLGSGFGGTLTMNMGTVSFFELEDVRCDWYPGYPYPRLTFSDGSLVGLEMLVYDKLFPGCTFTSQFPLRIENWFQFYGDDPHGVWNEVHGEWNTFDAPIPEPSTLVLFALGCLGLVGYVVRQKRRLSE
jgi:hypothetical protein